MDIFTRCVDWTLIAEGGDRLVRDAGGLTKWGIAERYNPGVDIASLDRDGAIKIYRDRYWIPAGCDKYQPPVAFVMFEFAVNPGLGAAIKGAQDAAGLTQDGKLGPRTTAALCAGELWMAYRLLERRLHYYDTKAQLTPAKAQFLRGWRLRTLRAAVFAASLDKEA
jgi:lysozyme family protein